LVLMVGVCVIAAGCGRITEQLTEEAVERGIESEAGGDVELDLDAEDGSLSFESDEGSLSFETGGDIPEELTIPLPDGYSVLGSSVLGSDGESVVTVTLEYHASDRDAVVEFYEARFTDVENVNRIENTANGSATWFWQAPEDGWSVSVTADDGSDTLSVALSEIDGQ
jgi:hypothetical protein